MDVGNSNIVCSGNNRYYMSQENVTNFWLQYTLHFLTRKALKGFLSWVLFIVFAITCQPIMLCG